MCNKCIAHTCTLWIQRGEIRSAEEVKQLMWPFRQLERRHQQKKKHTKPWTSAAEHKRCCCIIFMYLYLMWISIYWLFTFRRFLPVRIRAVAKTLWSRSFLLALPTWWNIAHLASCCSKIQNLNNFQEPFDEKWITDSIGWGEKVR